MDTRYNIREYFDNILNSLKNIQQGTQAPSQLQEISEEIRRLEKYVRVSFETLDHHFQAYVQQVNLLSNLIEFQRKAIHFKSTERMVQATFEYLKTNVNYDGAFIQLKTDLKGKNEEILTLDTEQKENYQKFLQRGDCRSKIRKMLQDKDLGILLKKVERSELRELPWEILGARSAILFPLRLQNNLFGFGVLFRKEKPLVLEQMTLINLILGLMTLLLFQHFYFFKLKKRLLSDLKLQNIFDKVKFADFFDKGPLYIYALDESGVILYANTAAHHIRPDESSPVGENFLQLLPPEQHHIFREYLHRLAPGEVQQLKTPVHTKDTKNRVWECFLTRLELKDQFILNMLFAVDITLSYYREQIERRNEVLDQIGRFSNVINKHLSQLMTVIVPGISLLRNRHAGDEVSHKQLKVIEERLEQTGQLLKDFLNYRLTEIEQPKRLELNKLILSVVTQLQEKCPPEIKFQYSLAPDIPAILLYPKRIAQLLKILIDNSREALKPAGGTIRVGTRTVPSAAGGFLTPEMFALPPGSYLELTVSDNGRGIPHNMLPHIFKPFFSTKIKKYGSGLGLFVAYKIVKSLNGEIFVKSMPKKSTTFYVYFPVKGEAMMVDSAPKATTGQNGKNESYILVVDDEFNIRTILKEILELHGFRVLTAENGKEALELFDRHGAAIDLVILDMVMPVMNGKETFKEIRKRNKDQKVIIISGYMRREEVQEILSGGALGFISKPFQIEDILNKVKSVLVPAN